CGWRPARVGAHLEDMQVVRAGAGERGGRRTGIRLDSYVVGARRVAGNVGGEGVDHGLRWQSEGSTGRGPTAAVVHAVHQPTCRVEQVHVRVELGPAALRPAINLDGPLVT